MRAKVAPVDVVEKEAQFAVARGSVTFLLNHFGMMPEMRIDLCASLKTWAWTAINLFAEKSLFSIKSL